MSVSLLIKVCFFSPLHLNNMKLKRRKKIKAMLSESWIFRLHRQPLRPYVGCTDLILLINMSCGGFGCDSHTPRAHFSFLLSVFFFFLNTQDLQHRCQAPWQPQHSDDKHYTLWIMDGHLYTSLHYGGPSKHQKGGKWDFKQRGWATSHLSHSSKYIIHFVCFLGLSWKVALPSSRESL